MVMAGGTGGHVFPALAVADELRARGLEVFWLGTRNGFEGQVVADRGYPLETVSVRGLRGKGLLRWLVAPFQISVALYQVWGVIRRMRPGLVLGMGGFASGPGGVMAWIRGIPLVIHEQNAVPGMTNRWLSRLATRVLEAFPGSFGSSQQVLLTGNPVRREILALPSPQERPWRSNGVASLLILGGSQGAQILNETLPKALARVAVGERPRVFHQAGRGNGQQTARAYREAGVEAQVADFVDDMAAAYRSADLVVSRSGALTIAELSAAGVGAILVPFPYAVDDHQTRNARYLCDGGAACLLPQHQLDPDRLARLLSELLGDEDRCRAMAVAARRLALPEATARVADICQEMLA